MLKKIISILEYIIVIVIAFFGGRYCYYNVITVHEKSCCLNGGICPIYACEIDSPDFLKYVLLAAGTIFCASLVILLSLNTIKLLFKKVWQK